MALYAVTIIAGSLDEATRLRSLGLDLHERAARRLPNTGQIAVPGVLDDAEIQQVRAAGYTVQVDQDLEQVAAERAAETDVRANRLAAPGRSAGDRSADEDAASDTLRTLESLMDVGDVDNGPADSPQARAVLGGYLTADEVEAGLRALAAAYPDGTTLLELPEKSWEGRTSYVLQIRVGEREDRIGVLVAGSIHAREWGGSDICLAFVTNLMKAYTAGTPLTYGGKTFTETQVTAILERLDLFVLPVVNPDGKVFSQTNDPTTSGSQGTWWRKNRNPNPGLAARGVDLNRNFDFLWSSGIGTSTNPSSFTYRGKAAFSEPEARNIRHLLDDNPQIAYFVDVHSFGELILYPWGDDDNQDSDPAQNFRNSAFVGVRGRAGDSAYREFVPTADLGALRQLSHDMNVALSAVRGRSYTVQQSVGLYPTSGTTDDYMFSRHIVDPTKSRIYGFTIEFGQEFVPPYAEMRAIMADVSAALTELCRRAADA